MSWLLRLYPRAWRRRYGAEVEEVLATQPRSLQLVIDLLAGAVDARLKPQALSPRLNRAAAGEAGGTEMLSRLKTCATREPGLRQGLLGGALIIGTTLVLSVVFVGLSRAFGDHPLVEGLGVAVFPAGLMAGMDPLYLRGHSWVSRVVLIGGTILLCYAIGVLASLF